MGSWYLLKCTNCNYEVESSAGLDEGFLGIVQTHICNECKTLVDVLIEHNGQIVQKKICNKCKSDKISTWDTKDKPCPKCDFRMSIGDEPIAMWD